MVIAIIGAGYVGLTTAAVLANAGYIVKLLDTDPKKIDIIKQGKSHFFEVGLDEFVHKAVTSKLLLPTLDYSEALTDADVVFSCVGTPDQPDGSVNLEYVFASVRTAAPFLKSGAVYAQKSTVPVGTGRKLEELFTELRGVGTINYVSNPEFLAEASALVDSIYLDRVVVGGSNAQAVEAVVDIFRKVHQLAAEVNLSEFAEYANVYKNKTDKYDHNYDTKVIRTSLESAELIKVTANAFLALKISFANSIARLCDETGADISQVMNGVGSDVRIGRSFLYAGLGWGGSCFPKDVAGLIRVAQDYNVELDILTAAVAENSLMVDYVINKLKKQLGRLTGMKIAVLGITFKPGTSDTCRSQAIRFIEALAASGAIVTAYDPKAVVEIANVHIASTVDECIQDADATVIATEWNEFLEYNWEKAATLMKGKLILDARNRINKEVITRVGLDYVGIGRN